MVQHSGDRFQRKVEFAEKTNKINGLDLFRKKIFIAVFSDEYRADQLFFYIKRQSIPADTGQFRQISKGNILVLYILCFFHLFLISFFCLIISNP